MARKRALRLRGAQAGEDGTVRSSDRLVVPFVGPRATGMGLQHQQAGGQRRRTQPPPQAVARGRTPATASATGQVLGAHPAASICPQLPRRPKGALHGRRHPHGGAEEAQLSATRGQPRRPREPAGANGRAWPDQARVTSSQPAELLAEGRHHRNVAVRTLVALIGVYRAASANRLPACRFTPSCSEYAAEALQRFGVGRGLALAIRRLARCRPGGGFGPDPVPNSVVPPRRHYAPSTADGSG